MNDASDTQFDKRAARARLLEHLDRALSLDPADLDAYVQRLEEREPRAAEALREALNSAEGQTLDDLEGAVAELRSIGAAEQNAARSGSGFGPYRLGTLLGRGGMGEVYRAERSDGEFELGVAIKVLSRDRLGEAGQARFRHERQLLASLEHRNIARLLDGGVAADGSPYLVMELVHGQPIDQYCDARTLSVEARIELFHQVLDAVRFAHRKLIVHRDLKPSNVFVSESGEVKLLDFGIAKMVGEHDPEITRTRERLMTPEYAAPEQIRGQSVSTATDVYSLGVLLFELITGSRPFEAQGRSPAEFQVDVLNLNPPRLSTAPSLTDQTRTDAVLQTRGVRLADFKRAVRGDLEAIVSKALRKEPDERYESVAALAEDLRRYLLGLPVSAVKGSTAYRVRKFTQRHSRMLLASAVVGVLVAAFGVVGLRQERAVQQANARASAVNTFLLDELLQSAHPEAAQGRDVVLLAEESAKTAFTDQPDLGFQLRLKLARLRRSFGDLEQAQQHLGAAEKLLGSVDASERWRFAAEKGELEFLETGGPNALPWFDQAFRGLPTSSELGLEALVFQGRRGVMLSESGWPEKADSVLEQVNDALIRQHPGALRARADVLAQQAELRARKTRRVEALELYYDALALQEESLGPHHPDLAATLERMAPVLSRMRRHEDAILASRRSYSIRKKVFGETHLLTLTSALMFGRSLNMAGRTAEGTDKLRGVLAMALDTSGSEILVSRIHNVLGVGLAESDPDKEGHFRSALEISEQILGRHHQSTLRNARNLAGLMGDLGRQEEADRIVEELASRAQEMISAPDRGRSRGAMTFANLAAFFGRWGPKLDLDLAMELAERSIELCGGRLYYPYTVSSSIFDARGNIDAAIEQQMKATEMPDALFVLGEQRALIKLLLENDRFSEASQYVDRYVQRVQDAEQLSILGHAYSLQSRVLLAQNQFALAEGKAREAKAQISADGEANSLHLALASLFLGEALLAQGRHREAEAELVAALSHERVSGNKYRRDRAHAALATLREESGEGRQSIRAPPP